MVVTANIETYYDEFTRVALNITKGNERDAQDLVQEFYLLALEYPDQNKLQQIEANGHIVFWGSRVMVNMYTRERGFFKKKYHRERPAGVQDVCEIDLQVAAEVEHEAFALKEQQYNKIEKLLSELHWYDRKIIEIYYGINVPNEKGYSVRGLSQATGISASSLFHTIKKTKKYLKNE